MMVIYRIIEHSALGWICLTGSNEDGLKALDFESHPVEFPDTSGESPWMDRVVSLLNRYLAGEAVDFKDIPLAPEGTDFQQQVWRTLQQIPWGATQSYQWVATQVGNPKASRAIGQANGRNPIPIIIPCHRVIQHNGQLGGYSGGLEIKRFLLALETPRLHSLASTEIREPALIH